MTPPHPFTVANIFERGLVAAEAINTRSYHCGCQVAEHPRARLRGWDLCAYHKAFDDGVWTVARQLAADEGVTA